MLDIRTGKELNDTYQHDADKVQITRRDFIGGGIAAASAVALAGSANASVRRGLGARLAANFSEGEEAMYKELYERTLATLNAIVDKTVDDSTDLSVITSIPKRYVFQYCPNITRIVMPNITSIGQDAFRSTPNVTYAEFANVERCDAGWNFMSCPKLQTVKLPKCTYMSNVYFNMTTLKDVYLDSMPFANRGQYFPWQCTTSSTVFHFADGDRDKDGNPV